MIGAGSAEPLYLQGDGEPFFGLYSPGRGALARGAILLCGPFGWEDICSYRSRRDWAEELAGAGHPTLRIDLPGSGDSAGGPRDPARLDAWVHAVSASVRWLGEVAGQDTGSGAGSVTVIGIGIGGLAAVLAASAGAGIDQLVLWAVPARGRTLVRELRAFSRLEVAHMADDDRSPARAALGDGEVAANGYLLSAESVAALEQLDLGEIAGRPWSPRRVLLLDRDGLKIDERLRAALAATGTEVTVAEGRGYGAMTLEPQDARAPRDVFERVRSWLDDSPQAAHADAHGRDVAPGEGADEQAREQQPPPQQPGAPPTAPARLARLTLTGRDGAAVHETPVFLDRPEGRLFGVLTEPDGERRELCAVLLNAGPQRHTGPNRMWVELARRWAARGVPTLRIDLEGIGDSDGDASALVRVASLYVPGYVEQARAALDMLDARGLGSRYLMVGLCSGAYWSVHAALADERVAGAVMLNPRALIWDEWVYAVRRTRDLRERLLLGSTWRRLLQGDITLARHLETARALAARALRTPLRARRRISASRRRGAAAADPVEGMFDALRDRRQLITLLLTGKEPLRAEFEAGGLFERLARWPNMRMEIRGNTADTHTLTPLWLQREVHELLDEALEQALEGEREGTTQA